MGKKWIAVLNMMIWIDFIEKVVNKQKLAGDERVSHNTHFIVGNVSGNNKKPILIFQVKKKFEDLVVNILMCNNVDISTLKFIVQTCFLSNTPLLPL